MRSRRIALAVVTALTVVGATLSAADKSTAAPSVPDVASRAALAALAAGVAPPDRGTTTIGRAGWQELSSAKVTAPAAAVSSPGFDTAGWLHVRPDDAGAPGTEMTALLQNGSCPHVFYSDTMRRCFGTQQTGRETVAPFADPWWYRTDFATPTDNPRAALVVNGVIGEADVWVNGVEVATRATVQGAYTRYRFDVTALLRPTGNTLAVRVYPNNPLKMFTVSNIDWTQVPPDQNTGIQFPVQLVSSADLAMSDVHVLQHDAPDLSSADLSVQATVSNATGQPRPATVATLIAPPDGGSPIFATTSVTVAAHATQQVSITPSDAAALHVRHPAVWWPYQMGGQPLYSVVTALAGDGRLISSDTEHVGIRTVSSRLIGPSPLAPGGVRQYAVNGRPFIVRGGGFDPDLFLRYSAADTAQQAKLLRAMGLDTVRIEGHFMPDDFYDQMDRAGILVAAGYSCCDAWELDPDVPLTGKQLDVLALSARTVAQHERDHPSVFTFQWSDNAPTPPQERVTLQAFHDEGFTVPVLASAEYKSSPQLGLSGEKEGPYDWVPPDYWYDRDHSDFADDSSLTNVGGSWGLDSEQSAGHTVPTRDSMNRFLSPDDQRRLWQQPKANQYHANPETGTSGYAFGTLYNVDTALRARYGPWRDLDGYVGEAQLQNYENVRAQFEAFLAHSTEPRSPSTGTIYWMANKGWPTLLWDLYNDDYDQAGSYFGAQEANRPVHAFFATDTGTVGVDNLTGAAVAGLAVQATVRGVDGTVLDSQTADGLQLDSQQVEPGVLHLRLPATTGAHAPARTYLVELTLTRNGHLVDRNTYWRSTRPDLVDWSRTEGNPQATMTQYADLTGLHDLAAADVGVQAVSTTRAGTASTTVTLTNRSATATALFLRTDVRRGDAAGHRLGGDDQVTTATWSADDVTLGPGETQTVTATYPVADLRGTRAVVDLTGWNSPAREVAAR